MKPNTKKHKYVPRLGRDGKPKARKTKGVDHIKVYRMKHKIKKEMAAELKYPIMLRFAAKNNIPVIVQKMSKVHPDDIRSQYLFLPKPAFKRIEEPSLYPK